MRFVIALALAAAVPCGARNARNVILFLGDGMGIPTVTAASIHGYDKPRALYIQNMPYIGLSETSPANAWVSDSAAGMTAIVTGEKTNNGVISQSAEAQPGVKDGRALKTILEYAEERGLSTGVVSNSSMADATPAACYAHSNSRRNFGEIFLYVLNPKFGDGVDVVMGPGRKAILEATRAKGADLAAELPKKGFRFLDTPEAVAGLGTDARRVVALFDSDRFDLAAVVDRAVAILSKNPKGFFLMVESNNHFKDARLTLDRTVAFDNIVRRTAERMRRNTLILVTADHSYGLRLAGGKKGEKVLPLVKVEDGHTAEEVLVSAEGPGAERVRGIFPNTRLFEIMLAAYGWRR